MASKQTIAGALAFLHELFPTRDITDATGHAYQIALGDFTDDDLRHCVELVAKEPGRKFFPTPGEIAAHRAPAPAIDTEALLDRISSELGHYNPTVGWVHPRPEQVRLRFGDTIADAYIAAGVDRCFAPESKDGAAITRDIARREFAVAVATAHRRSPAGLQLPAPTPPLELTPEVDEPRRQLPAGKAAVDLKAAAPAPSFPTSVRGRVAVGIAYRRALEDAAVRWASEHPEEDVAIAAAVDEKLSDKFATRVGRMALINDARAAAAAFPDFDAWKKQQGYVVVDPPQHAGATP